MKLAAGNAIFAAVALASGALFADKQVVDGVEWTYFTDVYAEVGNGNMPAIPKNTSGPVVVPSALGGYTVTTIGMYAFHECSDVSRVTMPDSVTRIGYRAFSSCIGLDSVILSEGLESIGEYAFFGCSGLQSVTIPQGVTTISPHAFEGCNSLVSVRMPKIAVDETVFKGCPKSLLITYWGEYALNVRSSRSEYGSVSGSGWYEAGTKVKISAQAKTGGVFAGWFADKACTIPLDLSDYGYDNRSPNVAIRTPSNNLNVYANFVSVAEAKSSLKFSSATKKLAKTPLKMKAGTAPSAQIGFTSVSLPTVTAKGLPKGLSINKATVEIAGSPTKPGEYTATVTVKDAAGNKITQNVKFVVTAASWVRGTFYGKARPGAKASDPKSYMKFTVGSGGKVSGKLKYKNKWRSFKSSLSYCTMSSAKLTPKVKIGGSTFKPGTVTITKVGMEDLVLAEASDMGGAFVAQKKPGLVKKEMPLDELIGKSYKITKSDNSKLGLKKGDKLVVKLGNGDKATVTGVVGGKKLSSISWVVLASSKSGSDYTVYVDILAPGLKRDCTLVLTATLDGNGVLQQVIKTVR